MRFPDRFENISEIEKKRAECVELIDFALRNMRLPRKKITQPRKMLKEETEGFMTRREKRRKKLRGGR